VGLLGASGIMEYSDILARVEPDTNKIQLIAAQIEKGLNVAQTSSLGRLFDAVSALIGLGAKNRFEAELPMALESIIEAGIEKTYPVECTEQEGVFRFQYSPIIQGVLSDIRFEVNREIIAAKFHNTICEGLLEMTVKAREKTGIEDVALSGGVFCNCYLANRMIRRLQQEQFRVLWKKSVPVNDGGIALGQAAIAAAIIEK
jgi:hydrogenase maturation protein HypF